MNLRMIALASAMLLAVPLGVAAQPWEAFGLWGNVSATVQNVEVFDWPDKKVYDPTSFQVPEQLVEGHTTFATIEMRSNRTELEGNVSIAGYVRCDDEVEWEWEGAPIFITRVRKAHVECTVGQRVIVTPDPFTGDPGYIPIGGTSAEPTGRILPFTPPGQPPTYAEELVYTQTLQDETGRVTQRTLYAWATPILPTFETPTGPKNFLMPIPLDRIYEMDVRDYSVVLEADR